MTTDPTVQPERQRVIGAGGRPRTVWTCPLGCWHGSHAQATRCIQRDSEATAKRRAKLARP